MKHQRINRDDPERVFITVVNAEAGVLEPGKVVKWSLGTNATQKAGNAVELVDTVVNLTTGLVGKVAGVIPVGGTIATAQYGEIQVQGYHGAVRSSASLASGRMVVASSINATNQGHVTEASQSTLTAPEYLGAIVGFTIEDSANATNAKVVLTVL
jgi:hypothetical protein